MTMTPFHRLYLNFLGKQKESHRSETKTIRNGRISLRPHLKQAINQPKNKETRNERNDKSEGKKEEEEKEVKKKKVEQKREGLMRHFRSANPVSYENKDLRSNFLLSQSVSFFCLIFFFLLWGRTLSVSFQRA